MNKSIAIIQPVHLNFNDEIAKEELGPSTLVLNANPFPEKQTSVADAANWDWAKQKRKQKKWYQKNLLPAIKSAPQAQIVYMGVAPIPLAAHLGFLVKQSGASYSVLNRDHGRTQDLWKWSNRDPDKFFRVDISGLPPEKISKSGPIIVGIYSSFEVDIEDARVAVPDAIAEIQIRSTPIGKNELRTEEELFEVAAAFEDVLDQIQQKFGKDSVVHLFTGVQCGLAFALGAQIHPSTHPNVITYQYVSSRKDHANNSPAHQKAIEIGMDNQKPIKVLLAGANPIDTNKLNIEKEFDEIRRVIEESDEGDRFEICIPTENTIAGMVEALVKFQPDIFHFAGHGGILEASTTRDMFLEDKSGGAAPLTGENLQKIFQGSSLRLKLMILNACTTGDIGKKVKPFADGVISMREEIMDVNAVDFSRLFYLQYAKDGDVESAFEVANAAIQGDGKAILNYLLLDSIEHKKNQLQERAASLSNEDLFNEKEQQMEKLLEEVQLLLQELKGSSMNYEWLPEIQERLQKAQLKWNKRRFKVSVMALVKAGKSTLLNAWIGDEYLPSATVAETMRVIQIRHNPNRKVGTLFEKDKELAKGPGPVRKKISDLNKEAREKQIGNLPNLNLEVNVAALSETKLGKFGFDILDTPGTNEAGLTPLRAQVERIAMESDVLIYLLDFTKLNTQDEEAILKNLKSWKVRLFSNHIGRVFFVVNKVDQVNRHDKEKQMAGEAIQIYVQKLLKKHLDLEVSMHDIVLLSAERALLSRRVETGQATKGQLNDFKKIAFGEMWEEASGKGMLELAIKTILKKSGFSGLNNQVLNVVTRNSSKILIQSVFEEIQYVVNEVGNNIKVTIAALESSKEEIAILSDEIAQIIKQVERLDDKVETFQKKTMLSVYNDLKNLQNKIVRNIDDVFSNTGNLKKVNTGLWGIFKKDDWEISADSEEIIFAQLDDVNRSVLWIIKEEFSLAWNTISNNLFADYRSFQEEIEQELEPTIRKIEGVLNSHLRIELNPQPVSISMPNLDAFLRDVEKEMDRIVDWKVKSNLNWIGRIFKPIFDLLGVDTVDEVRLPKYSFKLNRYKKQIREGIGELVKVVLDKVQELLEKKYMNSADSAISEVEKYGQKYIDTMQKTIDQKGGSEEKIEEQMGILKLDMVRLASVEEQVSLTSTLVDTSPQSA